MPTEWRSSSVTGLVRLRLRVRPWPKAVVAEWSRYRIVVGFVTSSSPVPLKTRRVGQRCTLNMSRAETSSRWCGSLRAASPLVRLMVERREAPDHLQDIFSQYWGETEPKPIVTCMGLKATDNDSRIFSPLPR
ncbi:hypothetical protein TNCV_4686601 [Trichonephila clavipes]|nr:hypothetical protein TNCV_4686601 [Trichonephila clavipes]